jgi:alpha-1,6-mannosyltransferase
LAAVACVPFALGAGWGLTVPLSNTGLFGAIGIYASFWNYNGGLYHWLEVLLARWLELGGASVEVVGWAPTWIAKLIVATILCLVLLAVAWRSRRLGDDAVALLRLALIPLAAYLLLTTTVHPWYVTLIVPLLPFLQSRPGEATRIGRFLVPGLYFSAVVVLSYLTYLDPAHLREYELVRFVEYAPLYVLLLWAAWPAGPGVPGTD